MRTDDIRGYMNSETNIKNGISGEIVVNDEYVGGYAGNTAITKVVIGSNVKVILKEAFFKCTGIKEIDFSNATNLIYIGKSAFYDIYNVELTNIDLSACTKLEIIDEGAFAGVYLQNINLGGCKIMKGTVFQGLSDCKSVVAPNLVAFDSPSFEGWGVHTTTIEMPNVKYIYNGLPNYTNYTSVENQVYDAATIFPSLVVLFDSWGIASEMPIVKLPATLKRFTLNVYDSVTTLYFKSHPVAVDNWWGDWHSLTTIYVPNTYLDEWKNDPFWTQCQDKLQGYDL